MALRYEPYAIPSSLTHTNLMDNHQLFVVQQNARLQTLKASINESLAKNFIYSQDMDSDTLAKLEKLEIQAEHKESGKNAKRNARRRATKKGGGQLSENYATVQGITTQIQQQGSLWSNPDRIPSYQPPHVRSLGLVPTSPIQRKDTVPNDVVLHTARHQPGQGFVPQAQASDILQHQPGQGFKPISSTHTRQHDLSPKAQPFIPQGALPASLQAIINPLAQTQKVSLSVIRHRGFSPYRIDKNFRSTSTAPATQKLAVRNGRPAGSTPSYKLRFSSSSSQSNTDSRNLRHYQDVDPPKRTNTDELIHLPAPKPARNYIAIANTPPIWLSNPQRLLLVLDLNGTLLYRIVKTSNYVARPGLKDFLDYCFANHSVLIWSSAKPHNVMSVCQRLFNPEQRKRLLGQWGRNALGLTQKQYEQRVQVYKNLDTVWNNVEIQSRHPQYSAGQRWGQHNTVLIDDSAMKAAAQPFNHVEVPEFVRAGETERGGNGVLAQVVTVLEEVRVWNDVSAFVRSQGGDFKHWEAGEGTILLGAADDLKP